MEKKLITVGIDEIVPYDRNPRKNEKAVGVVAESIAQVGYNNPIIVDENMVILAGHTRRLSLMKNGEKRVQVLQVTGLSEEQKKKYRLLDNKAGEYASWDYVALMEEMGGLEWGGLELDWGVNSGEAPEMEEFEEYDENIETTHKCPECGYEW